MSTPNHGRRAWPRGVTVGATVGLAAALAACGGTTTTSTSSHSSQSTQSSTAQTSSAAASSGGQQTAAAAIKQYESSRPLNLPGGTFNASKAKGDLVWLVEQKSANPAIAAIAKAATSALQHEGLQVKTCDAGGVSVRMSSCIRQGLALSAKAIIADGGDPASYSSGLKQANAAHVPVVSALDVPLPSDLQKLGLDASTDQAKLKGIAADAGPPDPLSGKLAADYIIAQSGSNAHVLFIGSPGIVGATYEEAAFKKEMSSLCSSCSVDSQGVEITNWASDLGSVVQSQLAQHSNINWVVPVFDPMAAYTDPAIKQAGKASSVHVVTVNGSLQQMQELQQGGVIVAEIAQDLPELGYQAANEALRQITGAPAVTQATAQVRVFTKSNIGSVSLTPAASTDGAWFTGSANALSAAFYKQWNG